MTTIHLLYVDDEKLVECSRTDLANRGVFVVDTATDGKWRCRKWLNSGMI